MGIFGTGDFENDAAVDWLADLLESGSLATIAATLDLVASARARELAVDACPAGLAADELAAAYHGQPARDLPPEAARWLVRQPGSLSGDEVGLALSVVRRLQARAAAIEWTHVEAIHADAREAASRDLERRLEALLAGADQQPSSAT